jgi:hypothetical protein
MTISVEADALAASFRKRDLPTLTVQADRRIGSLYINWLVPKSPHLLFGAIRHYRGQWYDFKRKRSPKDKRLSRSCALSTSTLAKALNRQEETEHRR